MGLKESGLRGSLRNVSVGIDAIPDDALYFEGDEIEDVTGGWVEGFIEEDPILEKQEETLKVEVEDGNEQGSWETDNRINLDDINELAIEWELTETKDDETDVEQNFHADPDAGTRGRDEAEIIFNVRREPFDRQEDSIDVSEESGDYHIGAGNYVVTGDPSSGVSNLLIHAVYARE